ncbi:MAG: SCO family protein [Anaerolineaceae bacterium]|nr:SCO family protein [Anaerolineaceae bacterium]MCB9100770.1 SCO family protein [Anaerolineales bacterium]
MTLHSKINDLIRHGLSLMVISLVMVGCQSLMGGYEFKGSQLDPPLPVPEFELMSTTGEPFHLSDAAGRLTLVYFGYTFCPDVCPLTMADVKQALAQMDNPDQVNVVFISVDPERDTPEVLARYLHAFSPDFIGLTDDFEKTQDVMVAFGAFAEKEDAADSAAGYLVSHTSRLYLLDPQGEIILTYSFGFEPDDLRADLEYLLEQGEG